MSVTDLPAPATSGTWPWTDPNETAEDAIWPFNVLASFARDAIIPMIREADFNGEPLDLDPIDRAALVVIFHAEGLAGWTAVLDGLIESWDPGAPGTVSLAAEQVHDLAVGTDRVHAAGLYRI